MPLNSRTPVHALCVRVGSTQYQHNGHHSSSRRCAAARQSHARSHRSSTNQAQHSRTSAAHWCTHSCVSTSSCVMPGQQAGSPTTRGGATRLPALEGRVGGHVQSFRAASRWGSATGHVGAQAVRGTALCMAAFTQSSGHAGRSALAIAAGRGVPVVHALVSSPGACWTAGGMPPRLARDTCYTLMFYTLPPYRVRCTKCTFVRCHAAWPGNCKKCGTVRPLTLACMCLEGSQARRSEQQQRSRAHKARTRADSLPHALNRERILHTCRTLTRSQTDQKRSALASEWAAFSHLLNR
jgi:hypothetical protein